MVDLALVCQQVTSTDISVNYYCNLLQYSTLWSLLKVDLWLESDSSWLESDLPLTRVRKSDSSWAKCHPYWSLLWARTTTMMVWLWAAITFCRRQSTWVPPMPNISTMMALMVIITQYKSRSSKRVGTRRPSLINLLALKPILSLGQSSAWSLALPQSSHTLAKNIGKGGKGNKCLVHMNDDTTITCGPELLFQL